MSSMLKQIYLEFKFAGATLSYAMGCGFEPHVEQSSNL